MTAETKLILDKLEGIHQDVTSLKKDVVTLGSRITSVEEGIGDLKTEVCSLKKRMEAVETNALEEKDNLSEIRETVRSINLTLENEVNRNIRLIAEGHLNLDRKLDEALRELQPNTMYHMRVNYLDGEVRKIKAVLNMA